MHSLVHARLPRGGLGNKFLVWARAAVFGALNELPVVTTGWADVKIGPLLRRERFKRYYFGYFRRQHTLQLVRLINSYGVCSQIREPGLKAMEAVSDRCLYVFRDLPRYPNYFDGLRDCRELIKRSLWDIDSPFVLDEVLKGPTPAIGVRVRRSDFREQAAGEIPGPQANVRTPLEYFIRSIRHVRKIRRCLILSHGSTFGYWAGLLADAPVIVPYQPAFPIRPAAINARYYEGAAQDSALLVQNIKAISEHPGSIGTAK